MMNILTSKAKKVKYLVCIIKKSLIFFGHRMTKHIYFVVFFAIFFMNNSGYCAQLSPSERQVCQDLHVHPDTLQDCVARGRFSHDEWSRILNHDLFGFGSMVHVIATTGDLTLCEYLFVLHEVGITINFQQASNLHQDRPYQVAQRFHHAILSRCLQNQRHYQLNWIIP